jgi:DNA-binding beta-propeller fold protein YncE
MFPGGMAVDSVTGNVYLCDKDAVRLINVNAANITTLAAAAGSLYITCFDLAVVNSGGTVTVYVTTRSGDSNNIISLTASATTPTFTLNLGSATSGPRGVATDGTTLFYSESEKGTINSMPLATLASPTTVAGALKCGYNLVLDAVGTSARFAQPVGVALDPTGSILYVSDIQANNIRAISLTTAAVTTLAGDCSTSGSSDGTGVAATFSGVQHMAVDAAGNIAVADTFNHLVRLVTPAGAVTTLAGVAQTSGYVDDVGTNAKFDQPQAVAYDAAGNLYVSDTANQLIRKIFVANGTVVTQAGTAGTQGLGDGIALSATFGQPGALAVDALGDIIICDNYQNPYNYKNAYVLRKLSNPR